MAYRLRAGLGGAEKRFALQPGENLVGSLADCDVPLDHPSVSRHHAVLVLGPGRLEVADLGSANGTSVAGRPVRTATALEPGTVLSFGAVEVTVEAVEDADLVAAGTAPSRAAAAAAPAPEEGAAAPVAAVTTASVGPLHVFALGHLPRLARALGEGRSREEMALFVGEALVGSLPARAVEIEAADAPSGAGVLFTSTREGPAATGPATVELGAGLRLVVAFADEGGARLYRPLVETAWELLMAARPAVGRSRPGRQERPVGVPAVLPEPGFLDPVMRRVYEQAEVVAAGDVNVLVQGESGTGKEILARYIHRASSRRDGPFVTLNCAALPRDLLEAELFGIERGVATGVDARPGKFEQADGGTLCLDEIGDMAAETQARILRVLQEGEVFRLGAQQPRPARVRVVSATNRDLDDLRRKGSFREDLYYRIADWVVTLPPLRERPADVPQLAAWFLQRESRRLGRRVAGLSRAALAALVAHSWPGNVRQLEREIARAVLFVAEGELLDTSRLSREVRQHGGDAAIGLDERLADHERRELTAALARSQDNVAAAAEDLRVPLSTFYRKLKRLGIERPADS